jgi:hypothetical protein
MTDQENWTFAAEACNGRLSEIRKVAAELNERDAKIERLLAVLRNVYQRAPWMHDVRDALKDEQDKTT